MISVKILFSNLISYLCLNSRLIITLFHLAIRPLHIEVELEDKQYADPLPMTGYSWPKRSKRRASMP